MSDSVTPCTAVCQTSLSITNSWSLPKLMSIESVMPCKHLILCCHLLLLPSIFTSIRGFSNESVLRIRWPKYWSFSFNIRPSKEHPGLISFRMDWLDLLAVQVTLKSLLQHRSSKASILQCSAFFATSEKGLGRSCNAVSELLGTRIDLHPPVLSNLLYTHLYLKRSVALARKQANKGKYVFVCFLNGANMVFPVVMYGCESWATKKAEH